VLCVDHIGPYTFKGKDGTVIDFMAFTMINPKTSWFEIVELPLVRRLKTIAVNGKELSIVEEISDKSSEYIVRFVNKTWLSRYPRCCYLIYHNGSEFKLNFEYLCESYGIKHKPTTVKSPQANAFLECVHQVQAQMLCIAELDMAKSVTPDDVDVFLDDNVAWTICSTYYTVLKASPGVAIFGCDMLFNIPFVADWNKIRDYRQHQTNLDTAHINSMHADYDYKVGNKVLVKQDGIFPKAESQYSKKPWIIATIFTNGTIRNQCGTKSEQINIAPYTDE
jgi:hypothetical protein